MQRLRATYYRRAIAVLPVLVLTACGSAALPAATHASHPLSKRQHPARPAAGRAAQAGSRDRQLATARAAAASTRAGTARQARRAAGPAPQAAASCPLFPADNIWNTDISRLPVAVHSAAWLRSMNSASTFLHPDFGPSGGYPYGMPFIYVTNAHPKVRVKFQYASDSDKGPYPFGTDTPIEGGPRAGGDRHALMVDTTTCTLYELWHARYAPRGRSTAGSGAIWNLRSNALRPAGNTSADAAGLPIMPGLLNFGQIKWAVKTGTPIRHAIRFTADRTRSAYIWPARHEAGSGTSISLPPMGARFRLKASFNVAGFCRRSTPYCADAKAVLVEMQHYGLILADNGSNWFFQGSAFPKWPDALVELLKRIPARAFEAVNTSCLMVSRNSGQARAHPGCPIG